MRFPLTSLCCPDILNCSKRSWSVPGKVIELYREIPTEFTKLAYFLLTTRTSRLFPGRKSHISLAGLHHCLCVSQVRIYLFPFGNTRCFPFPTHSSLLLFPISPLIKLSFDSLGSRAFPFSSFHAHANLLLVFFAAFTGSILFYSISVLLCGYFAVFEERLSRNTFQAKNKGVLVGCELVDVDGFHPTLPMPATVLSGLDAIFRQRAVTAVSRVVLNVGGVRSEV